jgi:hypothetical protein
MYEYS